MKSEFVAGLELFRKSVLFIVAPTLIMGLVVYGMWLRFLMDDRLAISIMCTAGICLLISMAINTYSFIVCGVRKEGVLHINNDHDLLEYIEEEIANVNLPHLTKIGNFFASVSLIPAAISVVIWVCLYV